MPVSLPTFRQVHVRVPKDASTREDLESRHLHPIPALRWCCHGRSSCHSLAEMGLRVAHLRDRYRVQKKSPLTYSACIKGSCSSSRSCANGFLGLRRCPRRTLRRSYWPCCCADSLQMLLSQRDFSRSVGIRESVGRCSVYDRARIAVVRLLHLLVPSSNILIPKRFVSALLREANVRNCHPSASVLSLPRIARLNPTLTASRNFKDSNESEN
jgi:hypothetical protein